MHKGPGKVSLSKALKSKGVATEDANNLAPVEAAIVKKFVQNGGNKGKAIKEAYKDAGIKVVEAKHTEVFEKPQVQRSIVKALEDAGVNDALIAKKIKQGLDATAVKIHEGSVVCEVPDHQARHKFVDTALKIRGDLGEGMSVNNANVQYNSFKDE